MNLFKLVGSVFVDTEDANKSLSKTDDKAKKTGETFKNVASGAAKVGTAIVGASAAAVSGVVALANSTAETADTIDKASIRMGVSTDAYQELAYAAGQSGVEMAILEKAAKALEGTDLNLESALNEVMALGTAEERAAKAAELFGNNVAYNLSPLIEQSGEDFAALTQRAHDLGLVMAEEDVKAGVELGDTMSDVTKSFQAIVQQIGAKVMPVVLKFANKILDWMPKVMAMFQRIAPILEMLFDKLMPPLFDLIEQILPILMDFLEQLLPPIIEIVAELLPIFVKLLQAFMPILQPILDLLLAILPPLLDIINIVVKPLIQFLSMLIELLMTGLGKAITWIAQKITEGWNNLKGALGNIVAFVQSIWEGIKTAFKAGVNGVIWFINKMIDGINLLLAPLRAVITAVGNMFGAKWSMGDVKIPQIPQLANGGVIKQEGWTVTGEEGPELQYMSRGSTVVPLEKAGYTASDAVEKKLDDLIELMRQFLAVAPQMGVYIDGNALVGKIAPGMDKALGRIAAKNERFV